MSYEPLSDGEVATVVTFLEIRESPTIEVPATALRMRRLANPDAAAYRELFRLVGARWLWFSRLVMDDANLLEIIRHSQVELYAVEDEHGHDAGMLELDFRETGECELAFLGLVPELSGKGHGRWLLAEAVHLARRDGVTRVHVHTCTLDHPAALAAYRRVGFVPFKRAIERFPDPRLLSILPRDAAPQIPIIGGYRNTSAVSRGSPASCK